MDKMSKIEDKNPTKHYFACLPYLNLRDIPEIDLGFAKIWNYDLKKESYIFSNSLREHLDKIFNGYKMSYPYNKTKGFDAYPPLKGIGIITLGNDSTIPFDLDNKQKEQKPKRVEELKNFPFKTFNEFKKALIEGVANVGVDRGVALQWIQNGIYSSGWQRAQALFLATLPFIATIGFIIYSIVTKSWLLLLASPALLIGFFIFHPSSAMIFGFIRKSLIGLTIIGLIWGIINSVNWLIALTLSLVIIWYAQRTIYSKAVNGMIRAVLEHEDLLCILWNNNSLNVSLYNGDNYWFKWKTENGKNEHYNNK